VRCPYTVAAFLPDFKGTLDPLARLTEIGLLPWGYQRRGTCTWRFPVTYTVPSLFKFTRDCRLESRDHGAASPQITERKWSFIFSVEWPHHPSSSSYDAIVFAFFPSIFIPPYKDPA
jgi:hypothetical protein